jgi:hypothetical protein
MSRQAEQRLGANHPPRVSRREIFLTHVHAMRIGKRRHISAIVDNHRGVSAVRIFDNGVGQLEKRSTPPRLAAQL